MPVPIKVTSEIQKHLYEMQDLKYRSFHKKLIPTVDEKTVIGVRTPDLRAYARQLSRTEEGAEFINCLPHRFYEENNLHAFIIESIKDYDAAVCETEKFLPYIDNWATCDCFMPRVFKKNTDVLIKRVLKWIKSDNVYTKRYAIGILMKLYLDGNFKEEYLDTVASVRSDEYYINMMIAWYFATALAKQYDSAIVYLEENRLPLWVYKKTVRKAIESYRISDETKKYLRTL